MPRALYVITRAQRRGAEVDATLLAEALGREFDPLVATLYAGGDPAVLGGRVPIQPSKATEKGPVRRLTGVDPLAVRHLRRVIKDSSPDLVVAYGGEPLLHAVRAARRAKVPVLYVKISMAYGKSRRGARRRRFAAPRAVRGVVGRRAAPGPRAPDGLRGGSGGPPDPDLPDRA